MPGQICAVALCKSNRLTLKKEGVNLAFHRFPKGNDVGSSTIRKQWINRCKRKDKFNPNTSSICGLHFTTNDYERDLQNELLGLRLRQVLKKTAVPTLNLNESKNTSEKPIEGTPSCKRPIKKENMDPVESLLTNASLSNPESFQLLDLPSTSSAMPSSYTEISEDPRTSYTQDTYKQNAFQPKTLGISFISQEILKDVLMMKLAAEDFTSLEKIYNLTKIRLSH